MSSDEVRSALEDAGPGLLALDDSALGKLVEEQRLEAPTAAQLGAQHLPSFSARILGYDLVSLWD